MEWHFHQNRLKWNKCIFESKIESFVVDVDVVVSDDTILDVEKSKKKDTLTEVDDARRTSSNVQMLRQVSVKRPTGFDRFTIKKKVKAILLQKFENLAPNLAV